MYNTYIIIKCEAPKTLLFCKLDKCILTLIKNHSSPQMKRIILEKPKSEGRLALPNFLQYY